MFLFNGLPFPVVAAILFALGVFIGSLLNLGIYQLAIYKRPISPWCRAPKGLGERTWLDRIPLYGWIRLQRETATFGKGFWIRPLLIELFSGIGLVAMFIWYDQGGLIQEFDKVTEPNSAILGKWMSTWFVFHSAIFALLVIATFIDFDEKTIPDWITIPGTVVGLALAALIPSSALPVSGPANLQGTSLELLDFCAPNDLATWHLTSNGLIAGLASVLIWCFALLPTIVTFRKGPSKAIQFFLATLWPRPRKTKCEFRVRERGDDKYHWVILIMAILLSAFVIFVWREGGQNWKALFSSLMGLAFGGGLVWAVRIIASQALGVEAMGFGDVTLMAMLGACLGWQPALLIFAFAPFASIVIAIATLIVTGEQKIAFGPYLCVSAVVVTIGWKWIWNEWAAVSIFSLGSLLLAIIGGALVLMGVMLFGWGLTKSRMYDEEDQHGAGVNV